MHPTAVRQESSDQCCAVIALPGSACCLCDVGRASLTAPACAWLLHLSGEDRRAANPKARCSDSGRTVGTRWVAQPLLVLQPRRADQCLKRPQTLALSRAHRLKAFRRWSTP